jgi:hypothetical protein
MQRNFLFLAAAALISMGATWNSAPAQQPEKLPPLLRRQPAAVADSDSALTKLLKERHNTAVEEVESLHKLFTQGNHSLIELAPAVDRLVDAACELQPDAKDRIAIREQHVEYLQTVEKMTQAQFQAGLAGRSDVLRARYERIDAEIRLLREKEKK